MTLHMEEMPAQATSWIIRTAQAKPEALLLLAAGCALLMRSSMSPSSSATSARSGELGYGGSAHEPDGAARGDGGASQWVRATREGIADRVKSSASRATDYAAGAARSAADYAAGVTEDVSAATSQYLNNASGAAGQMKDAAVDVGRTIAEQGQRAAQRAQVTMDRVLREQPLAVAALGLAAGAAVAVAFPRTELEDRALGGTREAMSEAADRVGSSLLGAAGAAGERLKSAAQERGITGEGVRELASEVAESFTDAAARSLDQSGKAQASAGRDGGKAGPANAKAETKSADISRQSVSR